MLPAVELGHFGTGVELSICSALWHHCCPRSEVLG